MDTAEIGRQGTVWCHEVVATVDHTDSEDNMVPLAAAVGERPWNSQEQSQVEDRSYYSQTEH